MARMKETPRRNNRGSTKDSTPESQHTQPATENEGDDEEYEIEKIIESKFGAYPNGKTGYLVKWKGYTDGHNSWVHEDDAANASELIKTYWKEHHRPIARRRKKSLTRHSDSPEPSESAPQKKRARRSKAAVDEDDEDDVDESPPKKKAKPRKSTATTKSNTAEEEHGESEAVLRGMTTKYGSKSDWTPYIRQINAIEKDPDGKLYAYFTLTDGTRIKEDTDTCKYTMPVLLIEFYESHLRWKFAVP
ncbi:hypothetical protein JAAARDRAFT_191712 [Jaapia argillacea MUCL 33604]|uniref:Chromo domain-containing protein n=1 Tax=Jaapia argillacea MUCL 33604 TaxID=933084 RepID=A0A067Q006_9AGAM|nr:hypothetical protein JAAARDRAFT_191712 [Jaapia argillacea MUCL 33604]